MSVERTRIYKNNDEGCDGDGKICSEIEWNSKLRADLTSGKEIMGLQFAML